MKILILGSDGFLGTKSIEILSKHHEVIGAGKNNLNGFKVDATNKSELRKLVLKIRPEVVLDTIALTSSTMCEQNPTLAKELNYLTAKNISEICSEINSWMVFISSSYIFDGEKGNYSEDDVPSPLNEYAKTKLMAEKEVLKNSKGIILRVDVMYGFNGKNKKNGVFGQILSGNDILLREFNQIRQPIFVDDVPRVMVELISKNQKGIFNLAGPDRIKMFDFLNSLEKLIRPNSKIKKNLNPVQIRIPSNATFDTSKIKKIGINLTALKKGLQIMGSQLAKN
jgi:dTDP-4-dehydrorhamnose reductase